MDGGRAGQVDGEEGRTGGWGRGQDRWMGRRAGQVDGEEGRTGGWGGGQDRWMGRRAGQVDGEEGRTGEWGGQDQLSGHLEGLIFFYLTFGLPEVYSKVITTCNNHM